MKLISDTQFRQFPMLANNHDWVRKFDSSLVIKRSENSLSFLMKLLDINLSHFNTPLNVIKVGNLDDYQYALLSRYLEKYFPLYDLNFKMYNDKDILLLFKNIFCSLRDAHRQSFYVNDLHPDNILVNNSLDYQFIDFDRSVIQTIENATRVMPYQTKYIYGYKEELSEWHFKINDIMSIMNLLVSYLHFGYIKPWHSFDGNFYKYISYINALDINDDDKAYLLRIYEGKDEPQISSIVEVLDKSLIKRK